VLRFAQRLPKGAVEVVFVGPGRPYRPWASRVLDRLDVALHGGER